MSETVEPKRIILIVWDWNKASSAYPIAEEDFDKWYTSDLAGLLIRVDKKNTDAAVRFLAELIGGYLKGGHEVLAFLHTNSERHGYGKESRQAILDQLGKPEYANPLKVNLFGGGHTPIYHDAQNRGFLGSDGNFASRSHDAATGAKSERRVVYDADNRILHPEPFHYVWTQYWVSTRRKVYSLLENLRLWTDAFDPADHKRFTQHLREEKGLLWPQLAGFTDNPIELKKLRQLPHQPPRELTDFSHCEQHVEQAYGTETDTSLGDLYRKTRKIVEQVAFVKSHKDAEAFIAARDNMYNALDALQDKLAEQGEALSYDTIALFPR